MCKLKLADLLVKPMHKITRYNLLFKRLLSYVPQSPNHESLKELIGFFSEITKQIDDAVHIENSLFAVKTYDSIMDMGSSSEVYQFALINIRNL